jgi:hypothetical protein
MYETTVRDEVLTAHRCAVLLFMDVIYVRVQVQYSSTVLRSLGSSVLTKSMTRA